MGWWLDTYLGSLRERGNRIAKVSGADASVFMPDLRHVYTALAMDRAGVAPHLRGRFQILETGDVLTVDDVLDCLKVALGAERFVLSYARKADHPTDIPFVFASDCENGRVVVDPRLLGNGSLVVVESADKATVGRVRGEASDDRFVFVADVVGAAFGPEEGAAFALVLYGDDAIVPPLPDRWSAPLPDVLVAASVATTAPDFVATLVEFGRRGAADVWNAEPRDSGLKARQGQQKDTTVRRNERSAAAQIVDCTGHKTLSQMYGFGEAGEWGKRLAEDLAAYRRGDLSWEDLDKGILLTSPPGCGKSTYARALAAECGLPLYVSTYAEWESRIGDKGWIVKSMNDAFEAWREAAKSSPVIVFIDEIDSLGARGANGQNDSFWSAVINALLAFLDGATPRDGVIVIAATNYPSRVDPALKRPGRLDREIAIPKPDERTLAGMLEHHLDVDPEDRETIRAARALRGRSPAELEQVCREARRIGRGLKRRATAADVVDLLAATRDPVDPRQDLIVRVHESGHAIAALESEARGWRLVHVEAQIVGFNDVGRIDGCVDVERPRWAMTRDETLVDMAHALAGRVAEKKVLGQVTLGSFGDLREATAMASMLVRQEGLGSTLLYHRLESAMSLAQAKEIEDLVVEAYAIAVTLTPAWRVRTLAALLVHDKSMSGDEVRAALKAKQTACLFAVNGDMEPEDEWPMAA